MRLIKHSNGHYKPYPELGPKGRADRAANRSGCLILIIAIIFLIAILKIIIHA